MTTTYPELAAVGLGFYNREHNYAYRPAKLGCVISNDIRAPADGEGNTIPAGTAVAFRPKEPLPPGYHRVGKADIIRHYGELYLDTLKQSAGCH